MRKLADPVRKVKAQVVGLDVHKRMITHNILDRGGREVACGEFGARPDALDSFLDKHVGRRKTHFALESSGYSLWIYDRLVARYGAERVHMAQAKKIRAIANSQEKNDANDAFWLAYLTHEGRLPESYVPPTTYRELRIATRERAQLVHRRTTIYQRVRAHLAQIGRIVPTRTLRSIKARRFLQELASELPGARGHALKLALRELEYQEEAIADWENRIAKIAKDLPEVEAIQEHMPGVGPVLASTIAAESGPIRRFHTAKAYAAYTGLTPSDRSTGGRMIHGRIDRAGSPHLRWALDQAVKACMRCRRGPGVAVGNWVRAKQKRMSIKGKARCAAARKLAESIWRLFHYGECFDPARPFGSRVA
jgi:transposase